MRRTAKDKELEKYRCRHCIFSREWSGEDYKGDVFLCKCKFYKDGVYSKFLSDKVCNKFQMR